MAFDPDKIEIRGSPVPLVEDVGSDVSTGGGQYDLSGAASGPGTFVDLGGKTNLITAEWLESAGKTQPLLSKPALYGYPRVSPDGNRLALALVGGSAQDLYIYDWRHDTMPRLTFNGKANEDPVWTRDGKYLAYDTTDALWWIRADGAGEPQKLLDGRNVLADAFSHDGKRLAYDDEDPVTHSDIWTVLLDLSDPEHPKAGKPEPFLRTPAAESSADFSPDGRWIAYASDESGSIEVFVRPFPGPGGKWQVSTGGGQVPTWSPNGRELFYVAPDNHIMVTDYTAKGDSFSYSKPRPWSDKQISNYGGGRFYDIAPDGKRFAVLSTPEIKEGKQGNLHATLLLNFFDEVRRRIPGN